MTLDLLLAALLGYFLGSVPSAYLMVRLKSREDIRKTGSGNVGALNSYLVTRSRLIGIAVLCFDLLKGILAVVAAKLLFDGDFIPAAISGTASVIGHNFPVWLNFKGGRGLATAAGAMLLLAWPAVPTWILLWGVGYILTRDVNVGNAMATLLLIIAALALPPSVIERVVPQAGATGDARLFMAMVFVFILLKHIDPVREFVQSKRMKSTAGQAETSVEEKKP